MDPPFEVPEPKMDESDYAWVQFLYDIYFPNPISLPTDDDAISLPLAVGEDITDDDVLATWDPVLFDMDASEEFKALDTKEVTYEDDPVYHETLGSVYEVEEKILAEQWIGGSDTQYSTETEYVEMTLHSAFKLEVSGPEDFSWKHGLENPTTEVVTGLDFPEPTPLQAPVFKCEAPPTKSAFQLVYDTDNEELIGNNLQAIVTRRTRITPDATKFLNGSLQGLLGYLFNKIRKRSSDGRIEARDIMLGIDSDAELRKLFSNAIISGAGVPYRF